MHTTELERSSTGRIAGWLAAAGLTALALAAQPATAPNVFKDQPREAADRASLAARKAEQLAAIAGSAVFHGFRFTDRQPESGITFEHEVVDDAGKSYKPVHYDHGNGLPVADVDGDGRLDLYFVSLLGDSELWRNLGGGKFENATAKAGVAMTDTVAITGAFADVDNDGDQDLYVTTVRKGNRLFENDGKGVFKDVSKGSGLDYVGHSSGVVFFDYDRDGLLDLYLTNIGVYTTDVQGRGGYYVGLKGAFDGHKFPERTELSRLYKNLGNRRFKDVTAEVGLPDEGWSGDASVTDLDGDSWPDLYVLNMQGDDHFFRNVEGKRFVDRTAAHFPKTPWGAMGIKFFDWDNDGRLDLYVTDMHSDMAEHIGPEREKLKARIGDEEAVREEGANNVAGNAFYRNLGGGRFEEISDAIGAENYWPWGVSVDDLNADGWQDVFVTASMSFPYRYGINKLLLNERGKRFVDAEFAVGVEPRRGEVITVPYFELDCSGADKPATFCKGRQGRWRIDGTIGTRSSAIFDLEGDGDLDIVTSELQAKPQVLVSDLAERRPVRWLAVKLTGTESNRDAIGTLVTLTTAGGRQVRYHDGKSGYLTQSCGMPLWFGLGDAQTVERLEVKWPSGRTQTVAGPIKANQTLEVVEEKAKS